MTTKLQIIDDFCHHIISFIDEDLKEIPQKVLELEKNEKIILLLNLNQTFKNINKGKQLLKTRKNKLFSSKEEETHNLSISLFGEGLTLKYIFNGRMGEEKDKLWKLFTELLEGPENKKRVKNDLLNIEMDENVNSMISDIVEEFKGTMDKGDVDPMTAIMGVTQKITNKYQDKLQSGEIEIDSLINDLQDTMPGVKKIMDQVLKMKQDKQKPPKEKVVIDENFSTEKVKVGEDKPDDNNINLQKILPMMNTMMSDNPLLSQLGNMGNMEQMTKMMEDIKQKKPEELSQMKEQMDKMMLDQFGIDVKTFECDNLNSSNDNSFNDNSSK